VSDFGGDQPDTFDGRLAGIARLIDTFGDETDPDRRARRRAAVVQLLSHLHFDLSERIADLMQRLPAQ